MSKSHAGPAAFGLAALAVPVIVLALLAPNPASAPSRTLPGRPPPTRLVAHSAAPKPAHRTVATSTPARIFPSAAEFARAFIGSASEFAKQQGNQTRIGHPDCVQAAPGRYMCSYAVVKPGTRKECHLMQARWSPGATSTITVTLAGRTTRCGSLREALRSLP